MPLTSLADSPSVKCPTSGEEFQNGIKLCKKVWITKATEELIENGWLKDAIYKDIRRLVSCFQKTLLASGNAAVAAV